MTAPGERRQRLWEVLPQFQIEGSPRELKKLFVGNIHDSYVSEWEGHTCRYLHQWINDSVFPDVQALMENIARVTQHIQQKLDQGCGDEGERTLRIVPSVEGSPTVTDRDGGFWRTYEFIEDTRSYDVCDGVGHAREAARMFGRFVLHLIDLDPTLIHETIPLFQHTPHRVGQLQEAVRKDRVGRAAEVVRELKFVRDRLEKTTVIVKAIESRLLPERVIHYDTKLNNILFQLNGYRGICVVDLDTVMPGSILYDFGDLARNASVPAAEDETDLSLVQVDLDLFRALVSGYLEGVGGLLSPAEIGLLAKSPGILALTLGMRFLTDYLNGDVYFAVRGSRHNLDRCRTQFKIVESFEEHEQDLSQIVREEYS